MTEPNVLWPLRASLITIVPRPTLSPCAALLAGVALALAGCAGGHAARRPLPPPAAVIGGSSLAQRFAGVPEYGDALGSDRAPFTLVEFADLQCPFCARYDRDVLPGVIERFVRTGRLRLELRPIAVLGPQSAPAAAAALAAGLQGRAWPFADLFYRNQLPENSGYVTWPFIARIAVAVPGLDAARLRRDTVSAQVRGALADDQRSAVTARITGTPGFRLGRTGGVLGPFNGLRLQRADFERRLEAALR
jgi:protein-disulfide isomerase